MNLKNNNDIRCPVCLVEFNHYEIKRATECPNCHTQVGAYMKVNDGYIKINWQELRILVAYSIRWMATIDMTKRGNRDMAIALNNIILQLNKFKPPYGLPIAINEENKQAVAGRPILSPYFNGGREPMDGDKIN